MTRILILLLVCLCSSCFAESKEAPILPGQWKLTDPGGRDIFIAINKRGTAGAWIEKGGAPLFTVDSLKGMFVFKTPTNSKTVKYAFEGDTLVVTTSEGKSLHFNKQAQQAVPSDGHKPTSRISPADPTAPADAH